MGWRCAAVSLGKAASHESREPRLEEICILLNDAWEVLSDPEKRKDYDAQIEPLAFQTFGYLGSHGFRMVSPWNVMLDQCKG